MAETETQPKADAQATEPAPQAAENSARADSVVPKSFASTLKKEPADEKKKNIVFSTAKGVAIGLGSAIVASAIGSGLRRSWEAKAFKTPMIDDMVKDVSGILGITIAGLFGYSHFQQASKHNKQVDENNQDRGR